MALLEVNGLRKSYDGVNALIGVDLRIAASEVHGLVGPNGAGKSTLIKIVVGLVKADQGSCRWEREGRGRVAVVMQDSQLCPSMTVAENVTLGRYPTRRGTFGWINRRTMRARVAALLEELEIHVLPDARVDELPLATRRMVEVAAAVAREPRLLVLDEPTAALGARETRTLLDLIERLRGRGQSVLFVTHRLDEVVAVSDRVTVLRDGKTVSVLERDELSVERLVELMTGQETDARERSLAVAGDVRLEVKDLCGDRFDDITFTARAGELAVVTGLVGSGRSSALQAVYGLQGARGEVRVDGADTGRRSPRALSRRGVRFVPEGRAEGLTAELSLLDNLTLSLLRSGGLSRWGFLRRRRMRALAEELTQRFDIKAGTVDSPIWQLSGGNQRKAMLASCFGADPKVMLVDEPTEGVDVGAKADIHDILRRYRSDGGAVVAIVSDTDECLEVGDRLLVMRQGRIVGELDGATATEETVMNLSFAGDRESRRP